MEPWVFEALLQTILHLGTFPLEGCSSSNMCISCSLIRSMLFSLAILLSCSPLSWLMLSVLLQDSDLWSFFLYQWVLTTIIFVVLCMILFRTAVITFGLAVMCVDFLLLWINRALPRVHHIWVCLHFKPYEIWLLQNTQPPVHVYCASCTHRALTADQQVDWGEGCARWDGRWRKEVGGGRRSWDNVADVVHKGTSCVGNKCRKGIWWKRLRYNTCELKPVTSCDVWRRWLEECILRGYCSEDWETVRWISTIVLEQI